MSASVSISIDDQEVMDRLSEVIALGKDLTPVFKAFGDYKVKETVTLFEQEKDPWGNPWEELSPLTLKYKKNPQILTESTDLRNSIYRIADAISGRIGTNKEYAGAHQDGVKKTLQIPAHRRKVKTRDQKDTASGVAFVKAHERKVDMPARKFLGFNDRDRAEIMDIVKDYLEL